MSELKEKMMTDGVTKSSKEKDKEKKSSEYNPTRSTK